MKDKRTVLELLKEYGMINEMMSQIPADLSKVPASDIDKEILRTGIIAEMDAVNLYEQMARYAMDEKIRKVLLDIAKEEKTHVGEFQALLIELDPEHQKELDAGAEEVEQED